jgi:hypothetical protein
VKANPLQGPTFPNPCRKRRLQARLDLITYLSSQLMNTRVVPYVTTPRPREESAEEKRERKRTVKAERQARRVEKKEKKDQFSAALKQQSLALARKDAQGRKL